jgi:succinyl-CoA synthetase beta subunit
LNLLENETKQECSRYGIPIPKGTVITDSNQTKSAVLKLNPPFMVKAQVLAGGRAKAGGIIPALSASDAQSAAAKLLSSKIKGLPVKQVLIEEKIAAKKELYLGVTIDRSIRRYVVLASERGGIDIEEVAEKTPKAIVRTVIEPLLGMHSFQALAIAKQLGYSRNQLVELSAIIQKLFLVCMECDAQTVEINPLLETETESFVAADARMVIDDNALFKHPKYQKKEEQTFSPQESLAFKNNLAYVKLDGNIGVVGNGAGLVMATIDLLNLFGGKPANFLDLGGGADIKAVRTALEIVLNDSDTKSILVNILGGITRCDEVAQGIVEVIDEESIKKPLVVRLVGVNQQEGQKILMDAGVEVLESMEKAAKQAIKLATKTRGKP